MTIEQICIFRCCECGKTYNKHPGHCKCADNNRPGKIIGPFTLISSEANGWKVRCNLCTEYKLINTSNLSRQKSCGCVPRWIRILEINNVDNTAKTFCKRCSKYSVYELPILEWCCDEN